MARGEGGGGKILQPILFFLGGEDFFYAIFFCESYITCIITVVRAHKHKGNKGMFLKYGRGRGENFSQCIFKGGGRFFLAYWFYHPTPNPAINNECSLNVNLNVFCNKIKQQIKIVLKFANSGIPDGTNIITPFHLYSLVSVNVMLSTIICMLSRDLSYQISNQGPGIRASRLWLIYLDLKKQFHPALLHKSYTSCVCTYLSNMNVTSNLLRRIAAFSRSSCNKLGVIDSKWCSADAWWWSPRLFSSSKACSW